MTTYASAPGTRLGGRYRLEDRIAAGTGWDAWKAIDETLARAVTVFTFAAGFPRIGEVVKAARAASRLTDPRLAQVFDVEDDWDHAYVVMEWAAGDTLADMLAQGPLEPYRAAQMIAEAATALSSAHAAGVAHMCLSPGSVRWSATGEIKVVGLGIDAALSGIVADDPVVEDTQGLGTLLYAALTGCWPGPEYPPLPSAPVAGGEPCSPRQVVAGIPLALSDLTFRAMGLGPAAEFPVKTPGDLARALVATLPPAPLLALAAAPATTPQRAGRQDGGSESDPAWPGPGYADTDWPAAGSDYQAPAPGRRRNAVLDAARRRGSLMPLGGYAKAVMAGVGVLVILAAVLAFVLSRKGGSSPAPRPPHSGSNTPVTSAGVLQPARASGFDPLTSPAKDPGNEDTQGAKYAIDNSMRTSWTSQWYQTAEFGRLKAGSGLLIDLGKQVRLTAVTVTFNSEPGARVKLLLGDSDARSKQNLDSMTTLASANSPTGAFTFRIKSHASGRYLVIWYTKLPPMSGGGGRFEAQIFNVAIRGTSQGQ